METIREKSQQAIMFSDGGGGRCNLSGHLSQISQLIVKTAKLIVENKNGQTKIKDNKKIQKSLQVCLCISEVISKLKLKVKDMIISTVEVKLWSYPQLTHHCLGFSLA